MLHPVFFLLRDEAVSLSYPDVDLCCKLVFNTSQPRTLEFCLMDFV